MSEILPFWHGFYIGFGAQILHSLDLVYPEKKKKLAKQPGGAKGQHSSPASIPTRASGEQTRTLLKRDNYERHPRDFSLQWPNKITVFLVSCHPRTLNIVRQSLHVISCVSHDKVLPRASQAPGHSGGSPSAEAEEWLRPTHGLIVSHSCLLCYTHHASQLQQ